MADCKACGAWFGSTATQDLCPACERALTRLGNYVAPVRHGRWVEFPRPHYFKCSKCKYTVPYRKATLINGKREYNFCPSCGAKMDVEE